tara:strand:+ start:434 stop:835 length:402 start_codon:yes stop_codon:yes gene_type:complete
MAMKKSKIVPMPKKSKKSNYDGMSPPAKAVAIAKDNKQKMFQNTPNQKAEQRIQRGVKAKETTAQKKRDNAYYVKKYMDYGKIGENVYSIRNPGGAGGAGASPAAMRNSTEYKQMSADKKAVKYKTNKNRKIK